MIVISDTTPILSLLKSNQLILLKKLYGSVIVPEAVYNELTTNPVFEDEKTEISGCQFIRVEEVHNQEAVLLLRNVTGLDAGESETLEVSHCLEALLDQDIRLSKNLCNKVLEYVGLDKKF